MSSRKKQEAAEKYVNCSPISLRFAIVAWSSAIKFLLAICVMLYIKCCC